MGTTLNPFGAPIQPAFRSYLDGPLVQLAPPVGQVLSLAEVKTHCRVPSDLTTEDSRISALIDECSDAFAKEAGGIQLLTAVYELPIRTWWGGWVGGFPGLAGILGMSYGLNAMGDGTLRLPRMPLQALQSITYYDTNDEFQTLDPSVYLVRTPWKQPGEIDLAPNEVWPALSPLRKYPVLIQFAAGYVSPFTASGNVITTQAPTTFTAGQQVQFSVSTETDATLPAPLIANTIYFVINPTNGGASFEISATSNGSAITLTTAGTGNLYIGKLPPNIRRALLLMIGQAYENREPGPDDDYAMRAIERLAAYEESGGYA